MSEQVQWQNAATAPQTGLVLSGGGAKGAYQVGVLKALLELDVPIHQIAGASIGALNGAVLAGAPSLEEGTQRLENLWLTLAESSPVESNIPSYLKLLAAAGLQLGLPLSTLFTKVPGLSQSVARLIQPVANQLGNNLAIKKTLTALLANTPVQGLLNKLSSSGKDDSGATGPGFFEAPLLADSPIKALMEQYLDDEGLMQGLPFYVSVFESQGGLMDVWRCLKAEAGLGETPPSEFLHIQSLPEAQRREALLASAAIPMLYQARQIDGARYTDGSQGGWQKDQGNTPVTPLIEAGCKLLIVTHLSDGSLWNRQDFPDTTVLEIRPQSPISLSSNPLEAAKSLLGFDVSNIARLMQQGYDDTLHCVGRVLKASRTEELLRQSEQARDASLSRSAAADAQLEQAMQRLR